jgi:pyridoxamine 5'-phosphate oxidase
MEKSIADLRKDYCMAGLRRAELAADPMLQFQKWLTQALESGALEPTAMTLGTVDQQGMPSGRTVLLKAVDERVFTFFSNYASRKGADLATNPRASLVWHWKELERQVCVSGTVSRTSEADSDQYFASRPEGSRYAAWVSKQSSVIANRDALEKGLAEVQKKFPRGVIPRPDYWGGFSVAPLVIEFWQGRPNRLHDRFRYTRTGADWTIDRLSP